MLTDARRLAVASAIAALAASTLLACWAGRDAVATISTAQRLARFAVLMALPGLAVAAAAPSLTRWARLGAVAGGAALIVGCAVWQRDEGGLVLVPAALLLLAAAIPSRSHDIPTPDETTTTETKPARADLVTAAALVGLAGLVGRAIALDADGGVTTRLSIVATGLVVLAWPLVGAALLPPKLRHRWLLAAGVAVVAVVVARAPAGGEPWLVPGAVLLLVAALAEPADDEDPVGQF